MVPLPLDPLASCPIFSCPKSRAQQGTIVGVCCSNSLEDPPKLEATLMGIGNTASSWPLAELVLRCCNTVSWKSAKQCCNSLHMVWFTPSRLENCATPVWPASQSYLPQAALGLLGCPWIIPMRSLHPCPCWRRSDNTGTVQGSVCRKISSQFFTASLHVCIKSLFRFLCLSLFFVLLRISVCESLHALFSGNCNCWPRQHRRPFQYLRSNHSLEHPESKLKNSA